MMWATLLIALIDRGLIYVCHFPSFSHFVDALLSAPPSLVEPQLPSPEVATTWNEISLVIASVEKQKSLLPEGQESPVLDVFQKLFLVMGFQVGCHLLHDEKMRIKENLSEGGIREMWGQLFGARSANFTLNV